MFNQPYLDGFVSKERLANPPSRIEPYLRKNSIGYFVNIDVVVKADHSAQRMPKVISSICLLLILGVSLYLGYAYLAINLVLFFSLGFSPIHESAKRNALEHVATLAVILYRWHEENPAECDSLDSPSTYPSDTIWCSSKGGLGSPCTASHRARLI
jgi:hypothetical protein